MYHYRRELDQHGHLPGKLRGRGVAYTREVLASAPDNLIAVHVKASKRRFELEGKLNAEIDALTRAEGDGLIMTGQVMDVNDLRGRVGAHEV